MLWRLLALLLLFWSPLAAGQSSPQPVDLYIFWREGCPHCERELEQLDRIAADHAELRIHRFEVSRNPQQREWLATLARSFAVEQVSVPFTVVGPQLFVGYDDERGVGAQIREAVARCAREGCPDVVAATLGWNGAGPAAVAAPVLPRLVALPLFGEVAVDALSLPALTVLLAAVDGFNPCAMWTLIFLLGLLVGLGDRLRMWLLGGAFIVASAGVYFLFLAAWLNAVLWLGMVPWFRAAIGLLAVGGGAYYLREFVQNPEGACKVTGGEERRRVFARLKTLAGERNFLLALTGIVLLAIVVNLVELICSAGIPAVYTQVLAMSALPPWQYYAYLLLYLTVFMLDDLLVFAVAMKTLQVTGLSGRYARWSHLIGGVVLVGIGLMLWFRPGWLAFA